ncbi:MAG: hypothetical protein HWN66_12000 [Candidatus Helarchaeota archaeon]|nr:hypothetical protein [Candidatus Helarchaeota archaeon]
MKRKFTIIICLTILFTVFFINLSQRSLNFKSSEERLHVEQQGDGAEDNFQKLEPYGYVNIFNVTMDKIIAEVGENITVSTVYSFLCNEGYERDHGWIGIEKTAWFEYKNSLIDGVEYYNVTEIISVDPNHFDAFDIGKGCAEVAIREILNPMNVKSYSNSTAENLEIRRAKLNYSLVEQYPLTVFSTDLLNVSVLVHNEHAKKYVFSNDYIEINISNKENSLNFSKDTDFNGFLNFTVNCSLLGAGNYTIQLKNDEAPDYESTTYTFQIEVLEEISSINYTHLNSEEVYTNVGYDTSNYSKALYLIECKFNANISYITDFDSGQCSKIGDQYLATIPSPPVTGTHQIRFIAQPIQVGKSIEFNETIEVKRRLTELSSTFFRHENQSLLGCQISVLDKLVNHSIETNNTITISAYYNESNWAIGSVESNSSGVALFEWEIPSRILEDYISFNFEFNPTQVYQFSSLIRNITMTNIDYLGPYEGYSSQNVILRAKLSTLNGNELSNQLIKLVINHEIFNLTTNANGEVTYSFTAPSYVTSLEVEFQFLGSDNILSSILTLNIEIKLDLLHQIWNSLGFILLGISIAILSLFYLKKIFTKRNLATLDVD